MRHFLREFQCLLERHIEETEFDLQDLEQRLKVSEIDRLELQKLLEEGTVEVEHLETRNADAQREFGKRTSHLQTRIKQAEREVHQCRKDIKCRDVELEELRAQVLEAAERMHAMESAAAGSQADHEGANSKVYEDQIQSVRKDFSGVSDSNTEIQLQCEMLQTSLDSKSDECRRLGAELHCLFHVYGSNEIRGAACEKLRELIAGAKENLSKEERFECPRSLVGVVIGSRGANVKEIQRKSGARVDILQDRDPCEIVICGSKESVSKASQAVHQIMEQNARESIECPFDLLEHVTGRNLEKPKEIERDTGARIELDRKFDPCLFHVYGSNEIRGAACEKLNELQDQASDSLQLCLEKKEALQTAHECFW